MAAPAVAAAGGLGRLTAIISADTSGFKLGNIMKDVDKFNKSWEGMNKKLEPAAKLWGNIQGIFGKLTGFMKNLIAPFAIAGTLFLAFLLTGEAGRDVFGAFGAIIGAFADILTASLMPAIQPLLDALVAMLPQWEALFGSDEWRAMMDALGVAMANLVTIGLDVV